jgi:SAM-dependent methyltransferase
VSDHQRELDRIRDAYRERDAAGLSAAPSQWLRPGYRFSMQQLEWALLDELAHTGARLAGGRVLDVGCGSGYFLHRLAEYGAAHATGIDLMEHRIEEARARYPTLELVAGSASDLPFEDGAFDVVTQFTALSSVLDPELRAAIAREMWRVLAPGGAVASFDMLPRPRTVRRRAPAGATATTPIGPDELRRLFPAGEHRHRALAYMEGRARLSARSRTLAQVLAAVPARRTHLLATVRKPA